MEIPAIVELLYPLLVLSLQDTRLHIAQQLGLLTGQLRQETKEKEFALSNVCSLTKTKEVLGKLFFFV